VRHLLPILGLALLAGCAPPTEAEPPARDALVVTLDTLRADHLGSYGYPRDTTPNLDALAARGVRFEGCRAPMATTLPSHLSLFTGAHPLRHGVLANLVGDTVHERDPGLVTLAEELGEAGYATAAFVGAYVLRAGAGLETGFERYDAPEGEQRAGRRTVDRALAWWREAAGRPRLLWVHFFEPHLPYEPPVHLATAFVGDGLAVPVLRDRWISDEMNQRRLLNHYDREVLHTDELVGELLEAVGTEAVVLVVGDHGEGLWQHGWEGHGHIWDEQLLVPAILAAPGLAPSVDRSARSISDLAPRLLDRLPGVGGDALRAQAASTRARLGDGHLALANPERTRKHDLEHLAWIEGRWALLRRERPSGEPRRELYDLERDPVQVRDLARKHPEVVERLEERLLEAAEGLLEGAGGSRRRATETELRHLEALGYGGVSDGR
jgi:choline-sulfatase